MHFDFMPLQCATLLELFVAHVTFGLTLALVCPFNVPLEIGSEIKRLRTKVARVRGPSGGVVDRDVALQGTLVEKGFLTVGTFFRFFARVDANMPTRYQMGFTHITNNGAVPPSVC